MKLRYRGNFYDLSAPSTQAQPSHQPIKMIYRGCEYAYQPQPIPVDLPQREYSCTVKLIYRGQVINHMLPVPLQTQPSAINWRYAMAARQAA